MSGYVPLVDYFPVSVVIILLLQSLISELTMPLNYSDLLIGWTAATGLASSQRSSDTSSSQTYSDWLHGNTGLLTCTAVPGGTPQRETVGGGCGALEP